MAGISITRRKKKKKTKTTEKFKKKCHKKEENLSQPQIRFRVRNNLVRGVRPNLALDHLAFFHEQNRREGANLVLGDHGGGNVGVDGHDREVGAEMLGDLLETQGDEMDQNESEFRFINQAPDLEKIAKHFGPDLTVVAVDADISPAVVTKYEIRAFPTI